MVTIRTNERRGDIKSDKRQARMLLLGLFVILCFWFLIDHLFSHQASVIKLDYLQLTPKDSPATIGRRELAQPEHARSGALEHVRFVFDSRQGWLVANLHATRPVDTPGAGVKTRYLRRYPLQTGDSLRLDGEVIDVVAMDSKRLMLRHHGGVDDVFWQGGVGGKLQSKSIKFRSDVCPEDDWKGGIKSWVLPYKRQLTGDTEEQLLFRIGGGVNCLHRWALFYRDKALLPPDSARIMYRDGRFWLAPGYDARLLEFKRAGSSEWIGIDRWFTPLKVNGEQVLEKIYIGRAGYDLQLLDDDSLRLTQVSGPVWRVKEWMAPNTAMQPVMTQAERFGDSVLFALHCLLSLSLLSLLAFALNARLQGLSGRLYLLVLVLQSIAAVVVAQLAMGGLEERFVSLASRFLFGFCLLQVLLALFCLLPTKWLCLILRLVFRSEQANLEARECFPGLPAHVDLQRRFDWMMRLVFIGYLAAMGIQALTGVESGLGGFQPVEASKWLIVWLATASALALFNYRYYYIFGDDDGRRLKDFLGIFWPLLLLFILTAIMMTLVRDFSPLLLIMLFLFLFMLQQLPNPHLGGLQGGISKSLAMLAVLSVCFAGWFFYATWQQGEPPISLMNADRFRVWADPLHHPHSGAQVLASMRLLAESGALGLQQWFTGNTAAEMALPAVQDDFIAAYLLSHFGYLPAALFVLLQLELIFTLLLLAGRNKSTDVEKEVDDLDYACRMFCLGVAWMLLAHWLISWSNASGLLPVMGQPMALLSTGGSNLLLFVLPCLLLCFFMAWRNQELARKE